MVNFKENYKFFKVPEGGPTFFRGGGGPTFSKGSNCLFSIETHMTCDFPGPPVPPPPPLDRHLFYTFVFCVFLRVFLLAEIPLRHFPS